MQHATSLACGLTTRCSLVKSPMGHTRAANDRPSGTAWQAGQDVCQSASQTCMCRVLTSPGIALTAPHCSLLTSLPVVVLEKKCLMAILAEPGPHHRSAWAPVFWNVPSEPVVQICCPTALQQHRYQSCSDATSRIGRSPDHNKLVPAPDSGGQLGVTQQYPGQHPHTYQLAAMSNPPTASWPQVKQSQEADVRPRI